MTSRITYHVILATGDDGHTIETDIDAYTVFDAVYIAEELLQDKALTTISGEPITGPILDIHVRPAHGR